MATATSSDEGGGRPAGVAKVFCDPIHGHIEVDPLSVKIMDTPQFQRLRNIKQLGGGYWLYPGACHNRFEHSLGVYYLAGRLVTELQGKQPELHISPADVQCVKIAGLCHDLGHGPFSHVFDQRFMKQAHEAERDDWKWKHEDASIEMFDHLIVKNGIKLEEYGLIEGGDGEKDRTFIEELINPPEAKPGEWSYKGRKEEKGFLYQIVSNADSGMDVDKWDYFARDSHYTGLPKRFDHMRLIQSARAIKVEGKWEICYRDKAWLNVYNMFYTRACLHREVAQHKTKVAVEMMITDALLKADDKLQDMKVSEAYKNMDTYTRLTDSILDKILYSEGDELKEARDILESLATRNLYRFIGETQPTDGTFFKESDAVIAIKEGEQHITDVDIAFDEVNVNYGKGEKNPVEHVRFWTKDKPNEAAKLKKEELSQMLPSKFADKFVRVYCKKKDVNKNKESIKAMEKRFKDFLTQKREEQKREEQEKQKGEEQEKQKGEELLTSPKEKQKIEETTEKNGGCHLKAPLKKRPRSEGSSHKHSARRNLFPNREEGSTEKD